MAGEQSSAWYFTRVGVFCPGYFSRIAPLHLVLRVPAHLRTKGLCKTDFFYITVNSMPIKYHILLI